MIPLLSDGLFVCLCASACMRMFVGCFCDCVHVSIYFSLSLFIIQAFLYVFEKFVGKTPRFRAHGGTETENLALQNIQVPFFYMIFFQNATFCNDIIVYNTCVIII